MAIVADQVVVELEAKVASYVAKVNAAEKRFDQAMRNQTRAAQRSEKAVQRSLDGVGESIKRTAQIAATALVTREVARYADAWTEAGNKIRAASEVSGIGAMSLAELNARATEARSAFEPYVDLYARLLRVSDQVNASSAEVAQVTDIVAKGFKAGGAAAQEQAAGILQLGQALGSGVLQGDELRSIRENAPLIAQAIADEFETTIGGLKTLGEEGALTSERVFRAILKSGAQVEKQFAQTTRTIGDGVTGVRNALIRFVGDLDDSVGATEALVSALDLLAKNLDAVAVVAGALAVRAIAPLAAALATRLAASAATAATALQLVAVRGGAAMVATQGLRGALALLGGPLGATITLATALVVGLRSIDEGGQSAEQAFSDLDRAMADARGTMERLKQTEQALTTDTQKLDAANDKLAEAIAKSGPAAVGAATTEVQQIKKRIAANESLRQKYLQLLKAQSAIAGAEFSQAQRALEREFASLPTSAVSGPFDVLGLGDDIERAFGAIGIGPAEEDVKRFTDETLGRLRSEIEAIGDVGELTDEQLRFLKADAEAQRLKGEYEDLKQAVEDIGKATVDAPGDGEGSAAPTADITGILDDADLKSRKVAALRAEIDLLNAAVAAGTLTDRERAEALEAIALKQDRINKLLNPSSGGSTATEKERNSLVALNAEMGERLLGLQQEASLVGLDEAAQRRLSAEYEAQAFRREALTRLAEDGTAATSAEIAQVDALTEALRRQNDALLDKVEAQEASEAAAEAAQESAEKLAQAQHDIANGALNAAEAIAAAAKGTQSWEEALIQLLRIFLQLQQSGALSALAGGGGGFGATGGSLNTGVGGSSSSGAGFFGSLLDGFTGLFRATGGPVSAGAPYRVAEAGTEIFQGANGESFLIPDQPGRILNNQQTRQAVSGGQTINASIVIQTPNPESFRRSSGSVAGDISRALANARRYS